MTRQPRWHVENIRIGDRVRGGRRVAAILFEESNGQANDGFALCRLDDGRYLGVMPFDVVEVGSWR